VAASESEGGSARAADRAARRAPARAAVIVVHGIGRQPPLATLGRLSQGLIDHARARGERPQARAVLLRVRGEPSSVLRLSGAPSLGGFDVVDVHEFAWQGLAQGRARPLAVLRWPVRTGLAPLRVRRHWRVLADAGPDAPSPWAVVGRQALIATALAWLVAALLVGVVVALLQLPRAWPVLGAVLADAAAALGFGGAAALALGAVPAAVAVASLWGVVADAWEAAALRRRSGGDGWAGSYAGVTRLWAWPAVVIAGVLGAWAAAGVALGADAWRPLADVVRALGDAPALVAGGLAAVALAWLARALETHVGDIALYVASDTSSAFHRGRRELQAAAAARLTELLRRGEDAAWGEVGGVSGHVDEPEAAYDAVVVVGHSLGSVIALDALDAVARDARVEADPAGARRPLPLLKLRGLLTFGSPLDKIAYFFREGVADGDAVHAQLLSFRHASRRRASRRDDGPYRLAHYDVPYGWLRWLHLHAPADPISDPLLYYRVDERRRRPYPWPWSAHGRYWHDPETYRALVDLLAWARD